VIIRQKLSVGTEENYKNMSGYLGSDKYCKCNLSNRKHKWKSPELRHSETGDGWNWLRIMSNGGL
jgi:hypothetical protein